MCVCVYIYIYICSVLCGNQSVECALILTVDGTLLVYSVTTIICSMFLTMS